MKLIKGFYVHCEFSIFWLIGKYQRQRKTDMSEMQFLYVTLIRMNSFTYIYYVVLYGFILGLLYGGWGAGGSF